MNLRRLLHLFRQFVAWMTGPALLVVIWGELTPHPLPPGMENIWDKWLHFTAYFGLALMGTIALRADRRAVWWCLTMVVLGGGLEIVQSMIGRDAELGDEIANTLGVLAGWSIAYSGIALLKSRKLVEDVKRE